MATYKVTKEDDLDKLMKHISELPTNERNSLYQDDYFSFLLEEIGVYEIEKAAWKYDIRVRIEIPEYSQSRANFSPQPEKLKKYIL